MDEPVGAEPGHGRDVDDAAPPLRLHDRRHRLGQAHRPRQVDGHDLVPHLQRQAVEVGEGDRLVVGGIVDEDVEAAEAFADVADQPIHRRAVGDVAGECRRVDLVARGQLAGDALGLIAALRIHDGDMHPLLRQRVADALPEPAVAARHQCDRALEIHRMPPAVPLGDGIAPAYARGGRRGSLRPKTGRGKPVRLDRPRAARCRGGVITGGVGKKRWKIKRPLKPARTDYRCARPWMRRLCCVLAEKEA